MNVVRSHRFSILSYTLFLGSFFFFLHYLFPSIYGGDTGELIVSSHILGVPHAPGYPLYMLIGKIHETIIPWANPAFRINLSAAVLGAASLVLFFNLMLYITNSTYISFLTAVYLGCMPIFFEQALLAEVFMLNLCILLGIFLLVLKSKHDLRYLYIAAFLFGIGSGNHHTLVLAVPAVHCMLQPAKRGLLFLIYLVSFLIVFFNLGLGVGFFLICTGIFYMLFPVPKNVWTMGLYALGWAVVGLSVYAYLPIRAHADPAINFGDPDTISRFLSVITRRDFGSFTLHPTALRERTFASLWGQVLGYTATVTKQVGIGGLVLMICGLWEAKRRKNIVYLCLLFIIPGPLFILFSNLSPNTLALWRLERFHLLPNIAVLVFIGMGILWVSDRICSLFRNPQKEKYVAGTILFIVCILPLSRIPDSRTHTTLWDFGNNILRTLAPQSTVILDTKLFDEYGSSLAYATLVEKKRPDIVPAVRSGTMFGDLYGKDLFYLKGTKHFERIMSVEQKLLAQTSTPFYYAVMDRQVLPPGAYRYAGLLVKRGDKRFIYDPLYIIRKSPVAACENLDYPTRLLLVHYPYFFSKGSIERGEKANADRLLETCMQYGRDMEWLMYNIGSLYSKEGDLAHAETYYNHALYLDPFFPETYFGLGFLYYTKGKYQQAEYAFKRTIELNPDYAEAYYNIGITQWYLGKKDSARESWNRYMRYKPDSPQARMIDSLLQK